MKEFLILFLTIFVPFKVFATDPQTAYKMVQRGEAVMIDVREEDEIKSGKMKDAKWFPLSKVTDDKNWKKEFTKMIDGKEIFLYCRSGRRSEKFIAILKENSITAKNIGGYEELKKVIPVDGIQLREK